MLDPFPIGPPAALANFIQPLAAYTSLSSLPLHIHEVLSCAIGYELLQIFFAPWISRRLFPRTYAKLSKRTRVNWDVHVVSFIQSVAVCVLAFRVMARDKERARMSWEERVWGYTGGLGLVQAFGCGYFLWDFWVSLVHVDLFGWGMLAHAVSALTVFAFGFRPFLNFYAPTFILYELSSPFLNIHWFLDKLALTGSNLQLANGIALLASFFGCRLVWGSYASVSVFYDVWRAIRRGALVPLSHHHDFASTKPSATAAEEVMRFAAGKDVPVWLAASYLSANICLNGLNWYWFGKMIEAIRKRFDPPFGTRGLPEKKRKGVRLLEGVDGSAPEKVVKKETEIWRGIDADGHAKLEVDQVEVRRRLPVPKVDLNGNSEDEFVP